MNRLLELATVKGIDLSEFPIVDKLIELELKEKLIDFNLANLEQAALIEEISQRAPDEIPRLASLARDDPKNKISFSGHFQNTLRIAKAKNILLNKYPNFVSYGEYLKDFSSIDLDQLLDELTKVEDRVYKSVIANYQLPLTPSLNKEGGSVSDQDPKAQDFSPLFLKRGLRGVQARTGLARDDKATHDALLIRSIDRYIRLLQTAYQIQMTTKDFNLFKVNEPDFTTPACLAFINRKLAELGYFQDLIPYQNLLEEGKKALEAFYDSVSQRDVAFLENTEKILKAENQKVAVLISGGYHTAHLKKLFAEKGYSMAVPTPIVTSETNQQKYEKLLLAPVRKEIKTITISEDRRQMTEERVSSSPKSFVGDQPVDSRLKIAGMTERDKANAIFSGF